eukprot:jgi/Hompol1/4189/HPOL_007014-RA
MINPSDVSELRFTANDDAIVALSSLPRNASHIMVAVEGSDHAMLAAKFTFQRIAQEGDVVTIVQAISPKEGHHGTSEEPGIIRREVMIELHQQIKSLRDSLGRSNVPFRVDVDWGDPRNVVLALADKYDADLLIVGTRGKSMMAGMVSGSVSQYFLQNARMAVVIVRDAKESKQ